MDEDVRSSRSPKTGENIDSDEEVIQRRPKKKVRHILDDDDSDGSRDAISTEKHDENKSKTKTKFTAEEVLDAILEAKSEDVQFSPQRSGRRSKIMPVLEDSSDESDDDDKINLSSLRETRANKLNDLFDAEESDEDEGKDAVQQDIDDNEENSFEREDKPVSLKGDLFDADSSSDEDSRSSGNSCRLGMLNDDNDDDDELFDESAISPHLLAKLKQGAAKKDKRPKRKSALRAEAMNIHSETQRLIRESQVVLPYHQPAPRPLQDFLERANRKQQEYRALRGVRDFVKAKVLEEVLAKNRLSSKQSPVLNKHTLQTNHTSSENTKQLEVDLSTDKFKAHSVHDNNLRSGSDITETSIDNNISSDNTSGGGGVSNNAGASSDSMDGVVSDDQQQNGDMNDTLPDIHVTCSVSNSRRVDIRTKPMDSLSTTDISEIHDSIYSGHETFKSFTDKRIFDGNKNCAEALEPMSCSISNAANLNIEQEGNDEVRTDSENIIHVKTKEGPVILHEVSNNHFINSDSNQFNLSEKTAVNQSTFLTPKIAALVSLDLKVTPQLSGNFDSYINLDGEKEKSTPVNPGVAKLMSRLFQHSTKKEKKRHKDVDISIIKKEKTVDQKDELTLSTFTYHGDEVEESPLLKLDTPGAKLMVLKDQLQVKMKQRREEARQKRQELYDIDNEEGYEGEKEEEEEAEMTDESDTDVDDDEYDDKFGEEEEMQEDEAKEKNPFADDEAEEDDEADDIEDEDDIELKLDVDDEDEDNDKDIPEASDEELRSSEDEGLIKRSSTGKKKSIALCISDEEEEAEDILTEDIFKAPTEKHEDRHFPVGGNHAICGSAENSTQLPSGQRSFRLSMPIEDSQDLYGGSLQLLEPTQTQKTQDTDQGFKFILDDSQSQLDSEGFLKSRSTVKMPVKSLMDDFNNTQDNMEQLLGLCSGQFAATQSEETEKSSRKSLFEESSEKALDGNMDELLGLCSGVFTNSNSQIESSQKKGVKRKAARAEEEDMECKNSFALISDNEQASDNEEEGFSDENEAQEDSDREELDSGMDEVDGEIVRKEEQSNGVKQMKEQKFHGFTYGKQHGKIRKEFLEMEAELSGSEYDSDENLDLAEEDDILELEEGDKDVEAMDEDAIRNQVGRVHLKQLIDDDKRELMKFQEMYLPDGDLYSEGGGRLRRFRWSNMDDDTQQDMFGGESDEENLEEDNENEFKWRKERFEREKFLLEQQEKEQDKDENNPFLKLGQVFLKKKGSVDGSIGKADPKMQSASSDRKPPGTPTSLLKLEKKGSFLSRSKQSLAKIAEMTKPSSNNLTGPKNSRNFVFQVISSDKEEQKPKNPAPAAQKKPSQISRQPEVKRPKLETQKSFSQSSIFNHF